MLDSHCHLDRYESAHEIAAQAAGRGVFTIAVTNLPSHFRQGLPHVRQLRRVRLALGLHPLAVANHSAQIQEFERCFALTSFIGEIGLDFSREGKATADAQLEAFERVVQLLGTSSKFVSVHSRRAEADVLRVLSRHNIRGVVFHWYSGTLNALQRVLADGHFLSVNPAMTLSPSGQEIIKRIPSDRLLTETDGPYVRVNDRPVRPWDVEVVERHVATLWKTSPSDVRATVWRNFQGIVGALACT